MKKNKKFIATILMFLIIISTSVVYARNWNFLDPYFSGNSVGKVEKVSKNIWATATVVIQILAVGAVVFAGLRYMFSAADDKADLKKEMIYLVLGAAIVFGATAIIQLITDATNQIL